MNDDDIFSTADGPIGVVDTSSNPGISNDNKVSVISSKPATRQFHERQRQRQQKPQRQKRDEELLLGEKEQEQKRRKHESFVRALEEYGSGTTGLEWHKIAHELRWTLEEVKVHAYEYLVALTRYDEEERNNHLDETNVDGRQRGERVSCSSLSKNNDNSEGTRTAPENTTQPLNGGNGSSPAATRWEEEEDGWNYEEIVLFENLLAKYFVYRPRTRGNNDFGRYDYQENVIVGWEEQVAAMIPNKTALDVRRRYHRQFGNFSRVDALASTGEEEIEIEGDIDSHA